MTTNIGMLTPDRLHLERSSTLSIVAAANRCFLCSGHSLFEFPRRLFLNTFNIDDDETERQTVVSNRFGPFEEAASSTKKKPKAWSVRARRDEPNLLRGDR